MSVDAKLSLLSTYQTRVDKLQKDIGMPNTGTLTNVASKPAVTKVKNDIFLNETNAFADDKDASYHTDTSETDVERESETKMVSDVKSSPMSEQQFGILRQYQQKASKLLYKIIKHPILTLNDAGEMVVFGKAEPGTDFDNLFKSMVARTRDLNQPGIKKLLTALKAIGVRSTELSSTALHTKYSPPIPRGSSRQQLAALKAEPSSIKMDEPLDKYVTPKHSSSSSSSSPSSLKKSTSRIPLKAKK